MPEPITRESLKARYAELCAQRDVIEQRVAPLRARKQAAAEEAEEYRVNSLAAAEELLAALGGAQWFALKKEIGLIAKALSGQVK